MKRFAYVVLGVGSLALAGQALAAETDSTTFTASATTQEAIDVVCGDQLNFGTLAVKSGNAETTLAVGGAPSTTDVYVVSAGQVASCTVSGVDNVSGATAVLTASTGTPNVTDGSNLDDVQLTGTGLTTLTADLVLSKTSGILDEVITVGGTLTIPTIPAGGHGLVDATVTLTVTD